VKNVVENKVKTSSPFMVLLDSDCVFCSGLGKWLRARAQKPQFIVWDGQFWPSDCPWPSDVSREFLVYYSGSYTWYKGEAAVLAMAWDLGGIWRFISILMRLVPRSFRRILYRFWSNNRYRFFGRKQICDLPQGEDLYVLHQTGKDFTVLKGRAKRP
jgi:predicted DCC family thiol-disulfide oxidoreductase YuxK